MLDINKIINEAISDTIDEDMELMNEGIVDDAKAKLASGVAAGKEMGSDALAKGKELVGTAKDAITDTAEKGRVKLRDAIMTDKEEGKMAAGSADNLAKVKASGLTDATPEEIAKEVASDVKVAGAAALEKGKEMGSEALSKGKAVAGQVAADSKSALTKAVAKAKDVGSDIKEKTAGLVNKFIANESVAVASAISAGLGAKTILEQLRKVSNK